MHAPDSSQLPPPPTAIPPPPPAPATLRTVRIFDTTLRDGEQCPGATLFPTEKVRIARQLDRLGVDIIEAGFPSSSQDDREAVRRIGEAVGCQVAALARCVPDDIRAAADSLSGLPEDRRVLHVFLGTSIFQLQYKLRLSQAEALRLVAESVAQARTLCPHVLFSAEDAMRTDPAYLVDVLSAAVASGAQALTIPDTVGLAIPADFAPLVSFLRSRIPELASGAVGLHAHCHNDLGLATANSLAALAAGCTAVHVTVNGIGERAGNCPLEELAMALRLRPDAYPFATRLRSSELYPTSRLVSSLTAILPQPHKPVVGANAFAHEAGIHQDGLLKEPRTYQIMEPATIGRPGRAELVLGRHSGRAGFIDHLARLGISLPPDRLQDLYASFQELAEKKRIVYDDDLLELLREHSNAVPAVYVLRSLAISAATNGTPQATVVLENDGQTFTAAAPGNGPVDAAFHAIDHISGLVGELHAFTINAVTRGHDALGEASLTVSFANRTVAAKASDTDIVTASVKAYLNALNRALAPR